MNKQLAATDEEMTIVSRRIDQMTNTNITNTLIFEDTYASNLLQPLLVNYPFIPFSTAALRPFCLAHMLNDIIINDRKNIIEFGAGISTILIGRLIKKNNLDATLLSIEHDKKWAETLHQLLKREAIDGVIDIRYIPLKPCTIALDKNKWYDLKQLDLLTKNKNFDMVIVDGPPAWEPSKRTARFPALPFISERLNDSFSIYLDDASRMGEKIVLKTWEKYYNIHFNLAGSGKTLAYFYGGTSLDTEPFYHL